jgi:hypothetical protein
VTHLLLNLCLGFAFQASAAPLPERGVIPNGTEVRAITLHYLVLDYLPRTEHGPRYRVLQYRLDAEGNRYDLDEYTVPKRYLEGHYYEGWWGPPR